MRPLSTPAQRLAAFDASAWFASRPDDLRLWISENARPMALLGGQRLFHRGEAASGIFFVVQGAIRITTSSPDGREALLALADAPLWFGEGGLFEGAAHAHDAVAEGDAMVLHVGQRTLVDFLDAHPAHWRSFGLLLARKLRLAFDEIEHAALWPATTRLARRLVMMAGHYGDWKSGTRKVVVVQQDQLGSMLSLSRQTVNRLLKEFEAQGFLRCDRGAIEILDLAAFKRFAAVE